MGRALILGPICTLVAGSVAACLWPGAFGIRSRPDYWIAGFGGVVLLGIVLLWIVLWWNERDFEDALDISSIINFPLIESQRLSDCQRVELTELDPRFEQNSGIRRWKKGR